MPDPAEHEELTAAAERARVLRDEINGHNIAYHLHDAPVISDAEYDLLVRELVALETEHPQLVSPDSPTQRVGASPLAAFEPHIHKRPMLSLGNAFSDDDLREFDTRVKRTAGIAPESPVAYLCELKLDGLSVSLTYENGPPDHRRDTRRRNHRRKHHV